MRFQKSSSILKIKQSSAMLSAIHGIGSVALGFLIYNLTGILVLAYIAGFAMFAVCVSVIIKIQDDRHTNNSGWLDAALFFLNLVFIAFGFSWGWVPAIILFLAFIVLGIRVDKAPTLPAPNLESRDDGEQWRQGADDIDDEEPPIDVP